MRPFLGLVFCVLLMYGSLMVPVHSQIYSSPDSALRFSQCLIQKMDASPNFNVEDRNNMFSVSNVMMSAMRNLGSGSGRPSPIKLIVLTFVTSLTDVIILDNPYMNVPRKNTYLFALGECSISSTGYFDTELVNEASRIMVTLENEKIRKYGESAFEESGVFSSGKLVVPHSHPQFSMDVFNPSEIQPSPVQSPFVPRKYGISERTIFHPPSRSFGLSHSSEVSRTNIKPPYPVQSASSTHSFVNSDSLRIQQNGQPFASVLPSSPTSQAEINRSLAGGIRSPTFRDLKILTDESLVLYSSPSTTPNSETNVPFQDYSGPQKDITSVESSSAKYPSPSPEYFSRLKPPAFIPQSGVNVPFRDYPEPETIEIPVQTSVDNNSPLFQEGFFDFPSSAAIPQSDIGASLPDYLESQAGSPFQTPKGRNAPQSQKLFGNLPPSAAVSRSGSPFMAYSDSESEERSLQPPSTIILPSTQKVVERFSPPAVVSQTDIPTQDYSAPRKEISPARAFSALNLTLNPINKSPFHEDFGDILQPAVVTQTGLPSQDYSITEGEEIPTHDPSDKNLPPIQTEFAVLSPNAANTGSNKTPQEYLVPESQIPIPSSSAMNPFPLQQESPDISQPESTTQITVTPHNSSLQSIILDILKNSPSFRNAFRLGTELRNAITLARAITEQSLAGYDSKIMEEALDTVSTAVSTVGISSPENYALAVSNALASVLKLHSMSLFLDGASIASSMLTNLDNTKQDYTQTTNSTGEGETQIVPTTNDYSPSVWKPENLPLSFESSILVPEDVNSEIFSNDLYQKLTGSFRLAHLFCSSDLVTDRMQTYFSLIKSSLSKYGSQISLIASSTISEALMEVPEESLCSSYARVISDILAEIFYENDFLERVDSEDILQQMELSVSHVQFIPRQTTSSTISEDNGNAFSKSVLDLQSSLSIKYSNESEHTTLSLALDDNLPSTVMDALKGNDSEDLSAVQQQHEKHIPLDSEDSFIYPSDSKPIYLLNESSTNYDVPHYYTMPYTTPSSMEIADQEYTEEVILIRDVPKITEIQTKTPIESSSDNGTLFEERFSEDLLAEFEALLQAKNNKSTALRKPTIVPSLIPIDIVVVGGKPKNADEVTSQPVVLGHPINAHMDRRRRKQKIRHTTTPRPNTKRILEEKDVEYGETIVSVQSKNARPRSGSSYVNQEEDALFVASSSDDSVEEIKIPRVSLQPSFQEPQSADAPRVSGVYHAMTNGTDQEDISVLIAEAVSLIASSSITFIRSENYNVEGLCKKLNEYAAIVNIPPLNYCEETAVIDYLLHVLKSTTKILKEV